MKSKTLKFRIIHDSYSYDGKMAFRYSEKTGKVQANSIQLDADKNSLTIIRKEDGDLGEEFFGTQLNAVHNWLDKSAFHLAFKDGTLVKFKEEFDEHSDSHLFASGETLTRFKQLLINEAKNFPKNFIEDVKKLTRVSQVNNFAAKWFEKCNRHEDNWITNFGNFCVCKNSISVAFNNNA